MALGNKITALDVRLFNVPLDEPIQDANHGLQTYFELITVTIQTLSGVQGVGYTYTVGTGGSAIRTLIEDDLAPVLIGADPESIDQLYDRMQAHMHWVGRGGVTSFAIAAVDVALWDIRGKTLGKPLWQMAGGHSRSPMTYRGGVDLNFPIEKLLQSIDGYLSQGFKAIKIKVGKPDLSEDVERLAAVRKKLGPGFTLMADANFAYDLDRAIAAAKAFEPFNLTWLEEPMQPDEFHAYGKLASRTKTPLAMGENLHTQREFELAFENASLAFIQPDAATCGGVTGFLRAAQAAARHGIPVCSHGIQELHVSLVGAQPNAGWLEIHSFHVDRYTTRPMTIVDGRALAPDVPGTGVEFDWTALEQASARCVKGAA